MSPSPAQSLPALRRAGPVGTPLGIRFLFLSPSNTMPRLLPFLSSLLAAAAAQLLALPLAAQAPHVRPPQRLDTTTTGEGQGPSVASDHETTAVVYCDGGAGGSNKVYAVVSDGRGLAWSAPRILDSDASSRPKYTQRDACTVAGASIYAVWRDERHDNPGTTTLAESDIFVNVSHDGGVSWSGDVALDKGYPPGTAGRTVRDYAVAVQDSGTPFDGSDDLVCVLISTEGQGGNEELYLVSSSDGGATWSGAVPVSSNAAGAADVDAIALAAEGHQVHVAWQDNRRVGSADDVWYQRSDDGGATWLAGDLRLNDTSVAQGDAEAEVSMAVDGQIVAVVWQEERTSATNEEVRLRVSPDGGATWGPDQLVGQYAPGAVDADSAQVAVLGWRILVAWCDHRNGAPGDDDVFLAFSPDMGGAWMPDVQLSLAGGNQPTFGRPRPGQGAIVLAWYSDTSPNVMECALSRDGGFTWEPQGGFAVSLNGGDVDAAEVGYNRLYDNAICAYLADDSGRNGVFAGGFRPQTLSVNGPLAAGQPASFSVELWPAADAGRVFGVLASLEEGSKLLPDGRVTGLAGDSLLRRTTGIVERSLRSGNVPGALTGLLGTDGAGATVPFPLPGIFPPGTALRLAAVAIGRPPLAAGCITDVETAVVQ